MRQGQKHMSFGRSFSRGNYHFEPNPPATADYANDHNVMRFVRHNEQYDPLPSYAEGYSSKPMALLRRLISTNKKSASSWVIGRACIVQMRTG
jgi:hypothetical protein